MGAKRTSKRNREVEEERRSCEINLDIEADRKFAAAWVKKGKSCTIRNVTVDQLEYVPWPTGHIFPGTFDQTTTRELMDLIKRTLPLWWRWDLVISREATHDGWEVWPEIFGPAGCALPNYLFERGDGGKVKVIPTKSLIEGIHDDPCFRINDEESAPDVATAVVWVLKDITERLDSWGLMPKVAA